MRQRLKPRACLFGMVVLLSSPFVRAESDGETLIKQALCYACHQMEAPSIGPPWRAIAARHGARKALMTEVLAGKIVRGGGGSWGLVPMVPNQRVTESEARVMAKWVLEQAPGGVAE